MWRSFFLALGIASIILGAESLAIETAILAPPAKAPNDTAPPAFQRREVTPPEWAPWSLLSAGAVVVLYSFTLPKRATT